MARKSLIVLTVLCLAVGLSAGFAGSAGAAHVTADDGGTTSDTSCGNGPQEECFGGSPIPIDDDPWCEPYCP